MDKTILAEVIAETFARLDNIRIDAGDSDHAAVIAETRAIESALNRLNVEKTDKPLTRRQLSRWLAQGNGEMIFKGAHTNSVTYIYPLGGENEYVPDKVLVRRWEDTEWHEPTVWYCFPEQ